MYSEAIFGGLMGEGQVWLGDEWVVPCVNYEVVATRPKQTKTIADSSQTSCSEGEKWTHTYDGQKVRWLGNKPDSFEEMAIQYQSGEYGLARVSALKPIKPTITKSEAWDKVVGGFFSADGLLRHYIVKG